MDDPGGVLAETPLLAGLERGALERLSAFAEPLVLSSGAYLYREGDPPDACFFVVSGRLRVTSDGKLLGYVGRPDPVGEMGAITGEPRIADVQAVRDSVVVRIDSAELVSFLEDNGRAMIGLSRLMIARLREQGRSRLHASTQHRGTFALVPASPEMPVLGLAEALVRQLGGWPHARLVAPVHVDAALGEGAAQAQLLPGQPGDDLLAWLNDLESRHRYVVFAATDATEPWATRCMHSADRVLVLGEAGRPPVSLPALEQAREEGLPAPVELVLLRSYGDPSPHTLLWRERTGARAHYFVHPWDPRELASVARQMTGRGVCLVLGGGGARGFAHIGLIRALEQLDIPIDAAGGASMGAFVAALSACGLDSIEMAGVARETFVRTNHLNDYGLPRVSLIRGRKFGVRLREIFEDRRIEELRRTYFCVSTNLTTGATQVHDRGDLSIWVGTSMSLPGVAPPVAFEGDLLCDGGVVDNLPTDIMQRLERGSIIASNVSTDGAVRAPGAGVGEPDPEALLRRDRDGTPRLAEILMRSATMGGAASMERAVEYADVYLRMPSEGIGIFDWKRIDRTIQAGYAYALEQLEPLRETFGR